MTQTNTTTLFVNDGGTGEVPIILLHSLAGNGAQWTPQLDHLRQTHRAIAIDLPNHGRSAGQSDTPLTVFAAAQAVLQSIDALQIERFILVGHSLGGSVAVAIAGLAPARTVALLLADSSEDATQMPAEIAQEYAGAMQSPAAQEIIGGHWAQLLDGASDETHAQVSADLEQTDLNVIKGLLTNLLAFDPKSSLARYRGPKHAIVTPSNDSPSSLHRLGAGFGHDVIAGTSHWLQLDKPSRFNQLMDQFLISAEINP